MWRWDETDGPAFTLELCESELSTRAYIIRQMLTCGIEMNLVELAVCRAVAVKLVAFAIAWLDSRLDLANVASDHADPRLEIAVLQLVETRDEIARNDLEARELVLALDAAAALLHDAQKACTGRLGSLPN